MYSFLTSSPYGDKGRSLFETQLSSYDNTFVNKFKKTDIVIRDDIRNSDTWRSSNPPNMSQHGMFIASIIKSIEPRAHVEVIPVLNPDGKGSLERLVEAIDDLTLEVASDEFSQILVNISLVDEDNITETNSLIVPKIVHVVEKAADTVVDSSLYQNLLRTLDINDGYRQPFIDFLKDKAKHLIVAAAGNDGAGKENGWPGFPARLSNVLSVGSARKTPADNKEDAYVRTDCSNSCTIPSNELNPNAQFILERLREDWDQGIYATSGLDEEGKGIKGLFLKTAFDKRDDGSEVGLDGFNPCGVADWSGTSFAAAIATGYVAWLCMRGMTAQQAAQTLLEITSHSSLDGRPVLVTTQKKTAQYCD